MGIPAGPRPAAHPFDQSGATSPNRMGRHGVLAGKLPQESKMGVAQTSPVNRLAHVGDGSHGSDAGPMGIRIQVAFAARPIDDPSLRDSR